MAEIDEIKEELNYLKVWLGIIVVTTIGLVGWLLNHFDTVTDIKVLGGIVGVVLFTIVIIVIDKRIKRKIKRLKDL